MSHTPPMPDAAIAPFPAHPAPRPHADVPTPPPPPTPPKPDGGITDTTTRRVIAGAAVGIGSAAIVAALLYTNRRSAEAQKNAARDRTRHREAAD